MSQLRSALNLEILENRQLMSAALMPDGRLIVAGDTASANTITVGFNADASFVDVTLNGGALQEFDASQVDRVIITGGELGDSITIDESNNPFGIETRIFAFGGNDSINAGSENDFINAGAGDDVVNAGGGFNMIIGGQGADSLTGGINSDTIFGGDGNDSICGMAGGDVLAGGGGDDSILAGSGGDKVIGALGNDTVIGARGPDTIGGGGGDDHIFGGKGDNVLIGGDGNDDIHGSDISTVCTDKGDQPINVDPPPPHVPPAPPAEVSTGTVMGRVVDSNGNPVAGASVAIRLEMQGDTASDGSSTASTFVTTTDGQGIFTVSNVPAGSFTAMAGKSGLGYAQSDITVTADHTTTVNLTLHITVETGGVHGTVTDASGHVISGASVVLSKEGNSFTTVTDSQGNYSFGNDPTGQYTLTAGKDGYVLKQTTVTITKDTDQTVNVQLNAISPPPQTGTATVGGTVKDPNGNFVASASVGLIIGTMGSTSTMKVIAGGSTDANGAFNFTNVPNGTYTLVAGKHGIGNVTIGNVVVADGQVLSFNLTLNPPTTEPT